MWQLHIEETISVTTKYVPAHGLVDACLTEVFQCNIVILNFKTTNNPNTPVLLSFCLIIRAEGAFKKFSLMS